LRTKIQSELERLNPRWCRLLKLDERDIKTNADGDVDLSASDLGTGEIYEYNTFRYPPCPICLSQYGDGKVLQLDSDGAWRGGSAGILKPGVIFFGENVTSETRLLVNRLIDSCDQILIVGTTLAVLSAQRLVRTAKSQGKRIAVITSGYVRGEESLLQENDVRIWWRSSEVLKHLSYFSGLQGDPTVYM
jgi:NAD-dependent deacetylase sirtuin 4